MNLRPGQVWICLLLAPSGIRAQDSIESLVRKSLPAVVEVHVFRASQTPSALGSGFFVDSTGLVATNLHVVAGADRVTVTLRSGETYEVAGFVAVDARSDAVILRVPHSLAVPLPLANSDSLGLGASIIAIGSPRGFQNTISTGVNSGIRIMDGVALLQHSAPTSPGSSGGPILDLRGRVVGMVRSGRTDAQNLNFAVPSNAIRALLPGDSVRPLSSLPAARLPASAPRPDYGSTPAGLTNLYLFSSPVSGYELVLLIELPSGGLTGAVFLPHPSGFYDVVTLSTGQRPGVSRDFDWRVGCLTFSGWVRDNRTLAGTTAATECADRVKPGNVGAFEAAPFSSNPKRLKSFRGAKLWRLHLTGDVDSLEALLATVSPKNSPEASVGTVHAWRPSPTGQASRYNYVYPHGRATASEDTLLLTTADFKDTIRLREKDGAVAGRMVLGSTTRAQYTIIGARFDLANCLEKPGLDVGRAKANLDTLAFLRRAKQTNAEMRYDIPYDASPQLRKQLDSSNADQLRTEHAIDSLIVVLETRQRRDKDVLPNAPPEFSNCPALLSP